MNHVGGILAGGLTNTDIRKKAAVGGLFAEFVRRVREHYAKTYGEDSPQLELCHGGHMFEPKVAELVFREMLAGEKNIRLVERHRVVSARVVGTDGVERDAKPGRRMDGAMPEDFGATVKLVSLVAENLAHPVAARPFRASISLMPPTRVMSRRWRECRIAWAARAATRSANRTRETSTSGLATTIRCPAPRAQRTMASRLFAFVFI